ncbi:MAG TPA: DUF6044 family protein [Bacillales bacterium]|nr:DUF6044 family protein [Bacillales bacterium]
MKSRGFWLAIGLLLLYVSPYFILGENAHVRIHDSLDSNIAWYKVLADTGTLFASVDAVIPNIMNGLPRNSLGTQWNLFVLMFAFMPPFTAYALNQLFLRLLAFFGMRLLLTHYFLPKEAPSFILNGTALVYALLPYWAPGGGSIAGLPLALYAFLDIRQGKGKLQQWAIIALLPFYSSFVLSFVFFLACLSILWLYDFIQTKRFNARFFGALAFMTAVYLFINYRIIYQMVINPDFVSHRVSFDRGNGDLFDAVGIAAYVFIVGYTHVIRLTEWIVLPVIVIVLLLAFWKRINVKTLFWLFMLNGVLSVWYGVYCWRGIKPLKEQWKIFETFNFGRFQFLEPPIWYICFALALTFIWKHLKWGRPFALGLMGVQIAITFYFCEEWKYRRSDSVTYKQFYSTELFESIQAYIGKEPSDYRVVSLGMHPSIAQYNGFYTLDGYIVSYPLEYKRQFRKIIAPELKKNHTLKYYYDNWGSRCYLFADELGKHYMFTGGKRTVDNLDFNTKALKKMGGDYVLSAVKIANANQLKLKLVHTFTNDSSPWTIYLYVVRPT